MSILDCTASIARNAIKDKLQGKALLSAKKLLMTDKYYNVRRADVDDDEKLIIREKLKKYHAFLSLIGCSEAQSSYLLDFAGYQEKGGEIETASHLKKNNITLEENINHKLVN